MTCQESIEEWRALPGWEGIYAVSNTGLVASLDRVISGRKLKGRVLKPSTYKAGTTKVNLCTGVRSASVTYTVGYLVLLAFVGPPKDSINVRARHIDGIDTNNDLKNLYWGPHGPNRNVNKNKSYQRTKP